MADFDRLKQQLAGFVRSVLNRVDYLAQYEAQVLAQNADGTLELKPDDARIPACSAVPIRYGIPGVTATVAAGARVLLGFAGGDPRNPVATLWESASVQQLNVQGGTINVTASTAVNVNGGPQLNLTGTAIGLNSGVQGVARIGDAVAVTGTAGPFPVAASGVISVGSLTVKAG